MPTPISLAGQDLIVVQHRWRDTRTWQGVDAKVRFRPKAFSGTGTPNLTYAAGKQWFKTREWTTHPDPLSGYLAVPVPPFNDPDLSAYVGLEVTPEGESPVTVTVPHDAALTSVTAEMREALLALDIPVDVALNAQVRAVWLTDLATTSPSPSPPSAFWTVEQTVDAIVDALDVHDQDVWAHSGPTPGWRTRRAASSNLSAFRLVVPTSTGSVEYADRTISSHRTRPIWLTLAAALSGSPIDLQLAGVVTELSWSWTAGPVYLGTDGQLTQTAPTTGFILQVGYATSPVSLWLERQPSIALV